MKDIKIESYESLLSKYYEQKSIAKKYERINKSYKENFVVAILYVAIGCLGIGYILGSI